MPLGAGEVPAQYFASGPGLAGVRLRETGEDLASPLLSSDLCYGCPEQVLQSQDMTATIISTLSATDTIQ